MDKEHMTKADFGTLHDILCIFAQNEKTLLPELKKFSRKNHDHWKANNVEGGNNIIGRCFEESERKEV